HGHRHHPAHGRRSRGGRPGDDRMSGDRGAREPGGHGLEDRSLARGHTLATGSSIERPMRLASCIILLGAAVLSASEPSDADRSPWSAVRSGDAAGVRRSLRQGANPDAALPSGWTALMEATKAGRLDVADALLAGGARPDARDRAAGTALDVAERERREAL